MAKRNYFKTCGITCGGIVVLGIVLVGVLIGLVNVRELYPIKNYRIPSSNMAPTIVAGDYITTVSTLPSPVPRGLIVIFKLPDDPSTPENENEVARVSRIVAVGGDTVELKGKTLIVNDVVQSEAYANYEMGFQDFPKTKVPSGKVFILGDNRDRSKDSRFWPDPFLPEENLTGMVTYIFWNSQFDFSRFGKVE